MRNKRKGLRTRKQIISTASLMFLEKGYYATSVQDIIDSVDISKGAFYYHFKSKIELFKTVVDDIIEVDSKILSGKEIKRLTLNQAIKSFYTRYYEYLKSIETEKEFSIAHFQRLYYEAIILLPETRNKIQNNYLAYLYIFTEKISKERDIPLAKAFHIARRLIFEFDGFIHWMTIFPQTEINEILDTIFSQKIDN